MKDYLNAHKRRELKKQGAGWVRPVTIKTALLVLRLIDLAIRIVSRFL